jgi:hypothetical protein
VTNRVVCPGFFSYPIADINANIIEMVVKKMLDTYEGAGGVPDISVSKLSVFGLYLEQI